MTSRRFTIACTLIVVAGVAAVSYAVSPQALISDPALPPFEFHREAATNPEDAATTLFHGIAAGSPNHFVRHLLLGVCDGPIATLQKFAECLHRTQFRRGDATFTFFDLPKGINTKKPLRVIASHDFDPDDKQVAALQFEMMSTYYGKRFMYVDVAAEGYDGLDYHTRIVVAQVGEGWYAIPRCRSSKSFYDIADAMQLTTQTSGEAK